jgi:Mn-dependent DtxR family transcriptional regulator
MEELYRSVSNMYSGTEQTFWPEVAPLDIEEVRVPISLLLTSQLGATDKVVWLALTLDAELGERARLSPTRLAARTGLSRPTVRKATAKLTTEGWYNLPTGVNQAPAKGLSGPRVVMPTELIIATEVSAQAKVVYGALQATPDYRNLQGVFTYASVARMMSLGAKTVKRAARQLAKLGWLEMQQEHKQAPICFSLCNPVARRYMDELLAAQQRLDEAEFFGQALMQEYLSAIFDSDDHKDNASPRFLVNPATGMLLELDRHYDLEAVAFEFNGPQHYTPTKRFSADVVAKQMERDKTKRELCEKNNVTLVVIHAKDLSWLTMKFKAGQLLPLRSDLNKKLLRYLDLRSRFYRETAKGGWAPTSDAANE